jgi:mannose/cellobiose epimerase-like protein (N-acyl-D-glucosamine 2-epimerase family)
MKDFKDPDFVKEYALSLIEFYKLHLKDEEFGGFYCAYLDNGSVYDTEIKDLISITRFIINFSFGILLNKSKDYNDYIRHGLEFLEIIHRDEINDGYHQLAKKNEPLINKKMTYGQAFCLCAVSNAYKAGIKEAFPLIGRIYDFLEKKLWEPEHSLYVDECSNDFSEVSPYRGQNSNMHMTEAMIAAFEATEDERYLDRAYDLAHKITVELANETNGMIWEHYNKDWEIDWNYNKDNPKNLYKPYGFLPGHFTEWAKLLLIIERYKPVGWLLEIAEKLYDYAIRFAWDEKNGGLNYTFDLEGNILDEERYYWVLAETAAASAILALRTGKGKYWKKYLECWDYSIKYFFDKKNGGWYRVLSIDKKPLSNKKSPPGKTDYHQIGACYEIFRSIKYYNK